MIAIDTAKAFWEVLLPAGLDGGALSHIIDGASPRTLRRRHFNDFTAEDEDQPMDGSDQGWTVEHTQWWFEFLTEKGGKGVSKDTWSMVCPPWLIPAFPEDGTEWVLTSVPRLRADH